MRIPSLIKNTILYGLALTALLVVLLQSDYQKIFTYMQQVGVGYFLLAIVILNIGQYFSALRFRYYYEKEGIQLSLPFSVGSNYVGMFWSLVSPGGLGGDGYKIYLLKNKRNISVKQSLRLAISNRASGIYALLLLIYALLPLLFMEKLDFSRNPQLLNALVMSVILLVLTSIGYFISVYYVLGEKRSVVFGALKFSLLVQLCTLFSMLVVWVGLAKLAYPVQYSLLFLVSALISIVPVSVGGIGLRELTFFYGSSVMNSVFGYSVDPELGVAISLVYFAVLFVSSMIGFALIRKVDKMQTY